MALSKAIELSLALFVVAIVIVMFWLKSRKKITENQFRTIITVLQVAGAIITTIYSWQRSVAGFATIERAFQQVMAFLGLELTQLLIAVLFVVLGISAYRFKTRNKKWYANVEVIIGILSSIVVARSLGPNKLDLAKWSTLAGCSYVIARGLGTHKEAIKEAAEALNGS